MWGDLRIPSIQSVWAHMEIIYTYACKLTDTQASALHVHVVTPHDLAKALMLHTLSYQTLLAQ